eukprot:gene4412-7787_t
MNVNDMKLTEKEKLKKNDLYQHICNIIRNKPSTSNPILQITSIFNEMNHLYELDINLEETISDILKILQSSVHGSSQSGVGTQSNQSTLIRKRETNQNNHYNLLPPSKKQTFPPLNQNVEIIPHFQTQMQRFPLFNPTTDTFNQQIQRNLLLNSTPQIIQDRKYNSEFIKSEQTKQNNRFTTQVVYNSNLLRPIHSLKVENKSNISPIKLEEDHSTIKNNENDVKRHKYTIEETDILEKLFLQNNHPDTDARKELAIKLQKTPRSIQIWFQNRRAKEKIKEINEEVLLMKEEEKGPVTNKNELLFDVTISKLNDAFQPIKYKIDTFKFEEKTFENIIEIELKKDIFQMNIILNHLKKNEKYRIEFHLNDIQSIKKNIISNNEIILIFKMFRQPRFSIFKDNEFKSTFDFTFDNQASNIKYHELTFKNDTQFESFFNLLRNLINVDHLLNIELNDDSIYFDHILKLMKQNIISNLHQ